MTTTEITRSVLCALTSDDITGMNKNTLVSHLTAAVQFLSANTSADRGPGRREDVLNMLKQGPATILDIANALNITTKNVSSQLSYLRKEGWVLHTDEKSRKYLAAAEPVKPEVDEELEAAEALEVAEVAEVAE